jgi:hypothetical protein
MAQPTSWGLFSKCADANLHPVKYNNKGDKPCDYKNF